MQDLLDCTDAFSVQALLSLHRTKMHERVTDKLLLLPCHQPSIQCFGISPAAPSSSAPSYGGSVITAAGTDECVTGLVYIAALGPDANEPAGEVHGARRFRGASGCDPKA